MEYVEKLEKLVREGKLLEALDFIEALSPEKLQQWQIQNLIGVICANCGEPKAARNFFEAALKQQPNDAAVLYNLAKTCASLGLNRRARKLLDCCGQHANNEDVKRGVTALRQKLAEQKGGRVLMAAYYFPPLSGSGVFRSLKFAKYLPLFGWEPTVLSTDQPPNGWKFADQSLLAEIPEGIDVIRIPDGIQTGRETVLTGDRASAILEFLRGSLRFSPEADRIYARFLATKDGVKPLLTFPCGALAWAYDTVQYIEKNLDLDEFDVIYTTSGPASAHLIGFYLKQRHGIPWVADYRDQWTFNPYSATYDPSNLWDKLFFELESILLRSADCNLTVEDSYVSSYEKHFGLAKGKIVSITNGYDEEDFAALQPPQVWSDKFTINYSGLLYSQFRIITPVLEAIRQLRDERKIDLSKLRFRIVGEIEQRNLNAAEKYGLTQIIEHTGYCAHAQALQANLDANLLLLFVGDDSRFKPVYTGKIFEYLRSGRPILALAPKGGVVDAVLRESRHGETYLSTQIQKIKAMILREYKKWERGKGLTPLNSPIIQRFERKALTKKLAEVLSETVSFTAPPEIGEHGPKPLVVKYLVICNGGYPTEGNPRCMFAHERILQYKKAGLDVDAFGFIWGAPLQKYEYQGVQVTQGGAAELSDALKQGKYEKLLIHFADNGLMYAIQQAGKLDMSMIIWCHGYEVLPWYRCWFNYSPEEIGQHQSELKTQDAEKRKFLRTIYARDNIQFIFVSQWLMKRSIKFVGIAPNHCQVIHNFINYEFFSSPSKRPEDRLRILSIKNHTTKMYSNDLTAKAIMELSDRSFFPELTFDLYGDGVLFESNYGELLKKNFPNVHIHREFLTHLQLRELFRRSGIFLSPTRMDSQQVIGGEAMSAGLSVVTANAGAIREFIDEDCGSLFEFDNYWMMAEDIEYLYYHPEEFLRKSQNAVSRIRTQCSYSETIGRELKLITEY